MLNLVFEVWRLGKIIDVLELLNVMSDLRAYVLDSFSFVVYVHFDVLENLIKILFFRLHVLLCFTPRLGIEVQRAGLYELSLDVWLLDEPVELLYWSELLFLFVHVWKLDI